MNQREIHNARIENIYEPPTAQFTKRNGHEKFQKPKIPLYFKGISSNTHRLVSL